MNANDSLERGIADVYEREAPRRAPDWVLTTVLETIESTPQRRVLIPAPWRFHHMNTFAKAALAAVVVIAIGAVGLSVLRPRSPSAVGGQPTPSAIPSASPSAAPSVPPLSETFTSTRHGFSMSYPSGWDTQPATAPATSGFPAFGSPEGDFMFDPALRDHLFLLVTSRPLNGQEGAAWADEALNTLAAADDCQLPLAPVTIDGGPGLMCASAQAATWRGDRGYIFLMAVSDDEPQKVLGYDEAYFAEILGTVTLQPDSADDTPASPSP